MSSSTSRELSRRERERQMRRRAMLDAAQSVFAEKGYARATLDEIAERAEFGKGTIYNYFEGGKEDILYAIFDKTYQEITKIISETFATDDGERTLRDRYHDLVVRGFEFYSNREDILIILQKEAYRMGFSDDTDRARWFHEWHERILSAACPAIEGAIETGEIRDLPATAVAHMLIKNLDNLLVHRSLARRSHETLDECTSAVSLHDDPNAAAEFLTSMLFDGLVTHDAPPLPAPPPERST
ncbi:TetR family transcriptional regulator [Longibacter salinarum]|uniref:TetR family transcriptional regulator n=1 Tax=Longibacter salinarum TaxID=1850348 RepID=A0A2A8CT71_9BACT|nr:TetR/AcrR family transcriptional regulator [Longibacter salinarum]PEN10387.1 TetR family transcriptional regulator [Longibacter salinarum]